MEMEEPETIRHSFGARLRDLRKAKNLSADELAVELKIHRNTIYQLERGEQWISSELLEKLSTALGVLPGDFFKTNEATIPEEQRRLFGFIRRAKPHQIETLLDLVEGFERRSRRKEDDGRGAAG